MPYPKNSINTGLALQVIASDSLPIPSPAAYTLLGTSSPLISGTVTSLGTDQLLDNSGVNFQSTISPLPVLIDDKAFNTTADPDTVLEVGAHIVTGNPAQSIGFITSSYMSPNLGCSIALALMNGGKAATGASVDVWSLGKTVSGTVCDPVFFDKERGLLNG
jgi:hypothetical protein